MLPYCGSETKNIKMKVYERGEKAWLLEKNRKHMFMTLSSLKTLYNNKVSDKLAACVGTASEEKQVIPSLF